MSKPIVNNKVSGSNSDQSQEHTNGDMKRGLTKDSSGEDDVESPTRPDGGFSSRTLINAKLDKIQGRTVESTHAKVVVTHMFDTIVESKDPTQDMTLSKIDLNEDN